MIVARLSLLIFAVALGGCTLSVNDPGTEPLIDHVYFPSGLILDPKGQFLYVSNGNSDLRYGGGTVQMIDTRRFDCAVKAFRKQPLGPTGCDITQAGADATADPASGTRGCQMDPLDPIVVNCDDKPFILADQTVKVGNFAGNMQMQLIDDNRRRLFVGVRGDPSITWIDVDTDLGSAPGGRALDCFTNPMTVGHPTAAPGCDVDHLLQTFDCTGMPGCTSNMTTIPSEPFGLAFDEGKLTDGSPYARLLVSSLLGGQVLVIDANNLRSANPIVDVSAPFFAADTTPQHRHGAFALAAQHRGDPTSMWYMTSNIQPTIATFRIADVNVVVPAFNFSIAGTFPVGNDVRSIAFEAGGNRAFFTENNPPSVVVLDTRPQPPPASGTVAINQPVDVIDVCQEPSKLLTRTVQVLNGGGTTQARTRVYVTCFLANQMMVIDPDRATVLATILVGRGPNDMALSDDGRGFVANFSEQSIGVLDLDPASPTANRMVARIGIPVPPMNP